MFNLLKKFQGKSAAVVLMYHRIIDLAIDPWQLAVGPENFEAQLKVLNRKYRVIAVDELLHQQKLGKIKSKTVCLTFDDAYLDNYAIAKPLLEKYNSPATFFIPPHYIHTQKAFWWDELLTLIMHSPELPENIHIRSEEKVFNWQVTKSKISFAQKEDLKHWVWNQPYINERCEIYMTLWAFLQPLPLNQITNCLTQLSASINNLAKVLPDERAMNFEQLKALANNALFKTGVHTMTHPALARHSKEEQSKELLTCKAELELLLNQKINTAAYPYGNYNDDTLQVMKENNLTAGFTTKAQTVSCDSDVFQLGRFHVTNQNQHEFDQQLKFWLK